MYASSTSSTTASGARAAAGSGDRRMRVVRLLRPRRSAPAFGFSLRGGFEHATGFFISKVEFNSEAQHQGLKVGDQVMSVNGYRVDDAIHTELAHFLAAQSRLKIKVRNVGIIPVKDKSHEAMSWHFVAEHTSICSEASSSPTLCHDTERMADLRLSILVPPRAKLGCGICKGPEWKPGIFVQFVREGGIAREAGLRPGDQIMSCNGHNFANITFNEAISIMKATGRLDLVVREGVGIELVSPESSGYNSSASSATGEPRGAPPAPLAPPAALRRRLASVAEEAADRADRLNMNRLKRRTWDSIDFDWKNSDIHNFDAPSDIEPDYDCPSIPNNPHTFENILKKKDYLTSSPSNKTIINLTEEGATIHTYDNQTQKQHTYAPRPKSENEKTVVVEVHHRNSLPNVTNQLRPPPPIKKEMNEFSSPASSMSLSNAIAEEIQRRKMNKKSPGESNVAVPPKKNSIPKTVENEKKKQHDALIDEFKKVHKKMFANQTTDEDNRMASKKDADEMDRQPTLPLRKADPSPPPEVVTNGHSPPKQEAADDPPPPPPMPSMNGNHNGGDLKKMINQINDKINGGLLNGTSPKNGSITRTPTPDYNGKQHSVPTKKSNGKDDKAELESIDSYKLKNPASVQPKPPPNYFMRAPNGTATMKKNVRPVSVTIGEYTSGGSRRPPSKLEFLNGVGEDGTDGPRNGGEVPLSNRLQSELVMTLSRSNLRKKTEAVDRMTKEKLDKKDLDQIGSRNVSLDKNFHKRYGNNILPLPPSISIPKVSGVKHGFVDTKCDRDKWIVDGDGRSRSSGAKSRRDGWTRDHMVTAKY